VTAAPRAAPRLSLADFVMGTGPRGGQPLPEGASVDYPPPILSAPPLMSATLPLSLMVASLTPMYSSRGS
jgi:hypothetical protein